MSEELNPYDAGAIVVLEGLEVVRKRPGMYVGSVGERGLHHLVFEAAEWALDENLDGTASRVEITLTADGGIRVADNGAGFPPEASRWHSAGVTPARSRSQATPTAGRPPAAARTSSASATVWRS